MPVMGGSQNSRLVFATVHDQSAQPVLSKIYAACASRFHGRNPASREKSPIVLQGRSRHAESQNEIKAFPGPGCDGASRSVAGTTISCGISPRRLEAQCL
jgi:hypothetical protein